MTRPLMRRPAAAMRAPLIAAVALSALAGWTAHAAYLRRALRAARCDPVTGLPGRAGWTAQAGRIMRGRGTRTVARRSVRAHLSQASSHLARGE